jgi:hypothetical protein
MLATTLVLDYVEPEDEGSELLQTADNHFPVDME